MFFSSLIYSSNCLVSFLEAVGLLSVKGHKQVPEATLTFPNVKGHKQVPEATLTFPNVFVRADLL